jgi:hypothetical protein
VQSLWPRLARAQRSISAKNYTTLIVIVARQDRPQSSIGLAAWKSRL